jgi:hypothetical protein
VFLGSLPLVAIHRLRASFVIATFLDEMPTVLVSLPIVLIANIAEEELSTLTRKAENSLGLNSE